MNHLAVYGTLRQGGGNEWILKNVYHVGECRIPGDLYVRAIPFLKPGNGSVRGDLYEVRDDSLWASLDAFEGVYDRTRIRLLEPDMEAWVYMYPYDVSNMRRVTSGDYFDASRRNYV